MRCGTLKQCPVQKCHEQGAVAAAGKGTAAVPHQTPGASISAGNRKPLPIAHATADTSCPGCDGFPATGSNPRLPQPGFAHA